MRHAKSRSTIYPTRPCKWCGQPTRRDECDACFDVTKHGMDRVTMETMTKAAALCDGSGNLIRRAWNAAMGYGAADSDAEDGGDE